MMRKIFIFFIFTVVIVNLQAHPISGLPQYFPDIYFSSHYTIPSDKIAKFKKGFGFKQDYIDWLLAKVGYKEQYWNNFQYWLAFQEKLKELKIVLTLDDFQLLVSNKVERDLRIKREMKNLKPYELSIFSNTRFHYYQRYLVPALVLYKSTNFSDIEIKEEFRKQYGVFNKKYRLSVLFFRVTPHYVYKNSASFNRELEIAQNQAINVLKKALKKLSEGMSFDRATVIFSDDLMTKYSGGYLGEFKPGIYGKEFDKKVLSLKQGEVSGILHTYKGYHIVKCISKKNGRIYVAHILKKVDKYRIADSKDLKRKREQAIEKIKTLLKKIQKGKSFEEIAKSSDDYQAVYRFQSKEEFQDMADIFFGEHIRTLKKGDISDIIMTEKGVWVVKVLDVKTTPFNAQTKEKVKKLIAYRKVRANFQVYGHQLFQLMSDSTFFQSADSPFLFSINGKNIFLKDYGEWLYQYVSSDVLLENYLSMLLFEREAKKRKITVSDKVIMQIKKKRKIQDIPVGNKNPLIKKAYELVMHELKTDLLASRIIYKTQGFPNSVVNELYTMRYGEIGEFYKVRYHVSFSYKKDAEKRINKIYNLLEQGTGSFAKLARKYSEDKKTAKRAGALGLFIIVDWPFNVYKTVKSLHKNQFSKPVYGKEGYHIFYMNDIKNGQFYVSHIFISDSKINKKRKTEIVKKMRKILKLYSEDKDTEKTKILQQYPDFSVCSDIEWVKNPTIVSPQIMQTKSGLHIVDILSYKDNRITKEKRVLIEKIIYNSIANYGAISKLGVELMKKNKLYYRHQQSDIEVLNPF